tara:strand:- start:737 stop:880 length:144 start_codon:yes stop_codon:yes gene_type:complete
MPALKVSFVFDVELECEKDEVHEAVFDWWENRYLDIPLYTVTELEKK